MTHILKKFRHRHFLGKNKSKFSKSPGCYGACDPDQYTANR